MWLSEQEFTERLESLDIRLSKRTLQLYRERRLLNVRRNPINKRLIQYHNSEVDAVVGIRDLLSRGYTLTSIKEHLDSERPQLYSGDRQVISALGLHFSGQNYSIWRSEGEDALIVTVFEQYAVLCFKTEQFDNSMPPKQIDIIKTAELEWEEFQRRISEGGKFNTDGLFRS